MEQYQLSKENLIPRRYG